MTIGDRSGRGVRCGVRNAEEMNRNFDSATTVSQCGRQPKSSLKRNEIAQAWKRNLKVHKTRHSIRKGTKAKEGREKGPFVIGGSTSS